MNTCKTVHILKAIWCLSVHITIVSLGYMCVVVNGIVSEDLMSSWPVRLEEFAKTCLSVHYQKLVFTWGTYVMATLIALQEIARFIPTVCMRRIRWSCEGFTSVHNKYTGYTLKHLLLRHMYNLPLPMLICYMLKPYTLRLPTNS